MKKKIIILGVALASFLMLATPCISAVNVQASEVEFKEKVDMQSILSNLKDKNILPDEFPKIYLIIFSLIAFIAAAIIYTILAVILTIGGTIAAAIETVGTILEGIAIFGGILAAIGWALIHLAEDIRDLFNSGDFSGYGIGLPSFNDFYLQVRYRMFGIPTDVVI